ncbi:MULTISPECIES: NAD(P)/FAD-dependent oxidoreductase [unclassified Chelatococcus]|uniref:flavin-containing monooxygenase n=1 Tax=unclassified Chelatococcus TaxID=2638111 RepID=UPI001BCB319A|nr:MULTISPECIES: NAD(P)/FAD-dependent oxidoreductase [unclassified Chelatococcus]MBS7700174.1 NAD(P)/FAD-dependent oxidoreductase [Chelatococcus sp. YT9]MBX3556867.1 NAD(P)/FAD-dependent oxidoreductase [Chelatococcus sp.]
MAQDRHLTPQEQIAFAAAHPDAFSAAIAEADIVPLLMSYVQLTGDYGLLREVAPHIRGAWDYMQAIPTTLQNQIRAKLVTAIMERAEHGGAIALEPPAAEFKAMVDVAVGETVPDEYMAVFREEMMLGGQDGRRFTWRHKPPAARLAAFKVVVVGAGFSGLAMAVRLQEAGIPYVIIEKNAEVGGTWLDNHYPDCGVDTPCHFFSYSFEPNPDWTHFFAKRDEILDYILKCAKKYDIRRNIRFQEEVVRAEYRPDGTWTVRTRRSDGVEIDIEADVFITAVGALNRPAIPQIPGLKDFKGPWFHTAEWDRKVPLKGRRVAMIGTGASGMQTGPAIAPDVESLTIFQRSPHWAMKHPLYHKEVSHGARWAMRYLPFYASWFRLTLFWAASEAFHWTLKIDPNWPHPERSLNAMNEQWRQDLTAYILSKVGHRKDLIPKVIPDYPPFGKRMLRDNNWYDMLLRDNVELVTDGVERVEPDGVIANGRKYPTDVIILATGFQTKRMLAPMHIVGADGQSIRDIWGDEDPRAHRGITVPGFPNFYVVYGPNTNLAHGGSAIFQTECQVNYIMKALREHLENDWDVIEVRRDAFERYNDRVDSMLSNMVWTHPGVTNWYKNSVGRVALNWPGRLVEYRDVTAEFDPREYHLHRFADEATDKASGHEPKSAAGGR